MATPTVTFDFDTHTVTMTVITTDGSEPGTFNIVAAPVSLPLQTWTLIWELVSEGNPAAFTSIDFPDPLLPSGNATIVSSGGGGPEWTAVIENRVESFNGFNYTICVGPAGSLEPVSCQDPTIAVTPDPPPGG